MKKNRAPGIITVVLALMMLLQAGCLKPHADVKPNNALASSIKWLALVDNGNYTDSWEAAAEALKTRFSQVHWVQRLHALREPKGGCISRRFIVSMYRDYPPGSDKDERIVIRFNTSFQNRKYAVERVALTHDRDGQWRVAAYRITPELPGLRSVLVALLILVVIVGLWLMELRSPDRSCDERRP